MFKFFVEYGLQAYFSLEAQLTYLIGDLIFKRIINKESGCSCAAIANFLSKNIEYT